MLGDSTFGSGNGVATAATTGSTWSAADPVVLGIAALSILPRALDAARRPLEFNSIWHVFIARNLSREWHNIAHPPLYLVLLRAVQVFGHTVLVYRAISIVSGVAAVYLVGRVLQKLGTARQAARLGALAMGLAGNSIYLSITVEAYALCIVFVLWSYLFYLDLFVPTPALGANRTAFAVLSCFAVLTHYFAGLYLAACVAAPVLAAAVDRSYRKALRTALPGRWREDVAMLLPPAFLGLILYELMAKNWIGSVKGLPAFYFDRRTETAPHFLVRTLKNTSELLVPATLPRARYALAGLAISLIVVLLITARGARADARRWAPALFFGSFLFGGAILGLLRLYPFGGAMRHQFLIFLFALLSAFVALDAFLRVTQRPSARAGAIVLCVAATGLSFVRREPPHDPREPESFLPKLTEFEHRFPETRVVHVDFFNLIGFFSGYHNAKWSFIGSDPSHPEVERYSVAKGERRFILVAHRNWWFFWFGREEVYRDLARSWAGGPARCESVFSAARLVPEASQPGFTDLAAGDRLEKIAALAATQRLEARLILLDRLDVFLEFCAVRVATNDGSGPSPPWLSTQCSLL
jgi:hypothetical protein